MIYDIRLLPAGESIPCTPVPGKIHPMLNRQYLALAEETLAHLQRLDENGYSGHISYILHMLMRRSFWKLTFPEHTSPRKSWPLAGPTKL